MKELFMTIALATLITILGFLVMLALVNPFHGRN